MYLLQHDGHPGITIRTFFEAGGRKNYDEFINAAIPLVSGYLGISVSEQFNIIITCCYQFIKPCESGCLLSCAHYPVDSNFLI